MKSRGIVNLPVRSLTPHPENPRKDLGDLTEMSESIKKNGVLQNLTVIPKDIDGNDCNCNDAFRYMVIIGHRRLAAAKAAGVDQVPCRIVEGMTHDEQLLTMLEENMQRSDLTVFDQAQGFQMMLDLGQTVEDIEEKSGFSKTTIYHRLNIAKLDKEALKEKQDNEFFQLNLTDLIELEKIKSIDKRNEILKKARDSANLKYLATQAAAEEIRQEGFEKITSFLETIGVKKLPDSIKSWNCDHIYTLPLSDPDLEDVELTEGETYYYNKNWDTVSVLAPRKEEKQTKKTDDPRAGAYNLMIETRNALREENDRFKRSRTQILKDIVLQKLKPECAEEVAGKALWKAALMIGADFDLDKMNDYFMEIAGVNLDNFDSPEEAEELCKANRNDMLDRWPFSRQCALILADAWFGDPVSTYTYEVAQEHLEEWEALDIALRNFGFIPPEEDKALLDGSSPIIKAAKEADEAYKNM